MKRQSAEKIRVGVVSLGCAKNAVDLQVMMGHLLGDGCEFAGGGEPADVMLVNTCAFIESAREEAAEEILRACEMKRAGECGAVVVSGCFAQRYAEQLPEAFPEVDAFVGIDALDKIAGIVKRAAARRGKAAALAVPAGEPHKTFDPPEPALRLTGATYAYLKIAEGCAHKCAYCAIPGIRGKYRSRPVASIIAEAKELLATGVKELNVIAQDPMLYGVDLRGKGKTDITGLLRELDKLPGEFWVRVLYSYPSEITDEFLEWMNTSPHAVKYIDVPLQHTAPKILKAMARGTAVEASLGAAERLRAAVPGVTLRTTVMTGFPGETPKDFAQMVEDLKRMKFDRLGAFAFSPEEGTAAAEMPGRPSAKTAAKREAEVMAVQKKIWQAQARKLKGKVFRGLAVADGVVRLESQAPDVDGVTLVPEGSVKPGEWVEVRIVRARGYDLEAELA